MIFVFYKINRFMTLKADERQIFLRAMVLLPIVSFRVEFISIKNTLAWLRHGTQRPNSTMEGEQELAVTRRTAWLVRKAIYYSPIKGKCLSQSLVLWHLLSYRGIESDIRIGVQKGEEKSPLVVKNFKAHAWVEYKGEVLNDLPDVRQRYSTFEQVLAPPDSK